MILFSFDLLELGFWTRSIILVMVCSANFHKITAPSLFSSYTKRIAYFPQVTVQQQVQHIVLGQCPKKARISPISMDTPPNGNLKIQQIIRALFEHVLLFLKAVKSPIYNFFLGYYLPSSLNCYFRLVKPLLLQFKLSQNHIVFQYW